MNITVAQEDQITLDEYWEGELLPLRGKRTGAPVELDRKALKTIHKRIRRHEADVRAAMALPENQVFAPAVLRRLDGEPDPVGAGLIAALMQDGQGYSQSYLRPDFDAWVAEHGLPFAVAAAVVCYAHGRRSGNRWSQSTPIELVVLKTHPAAELAGLFAETRTGIATIRGLLAAASDDEYAAAVAATAKVRTSASERFIASVLLPGQTDWADEVCREYEPADAYYGNRLIWECITLPEQASLVGLSRLDAWGNSDLLLGTVVDRLGRAAFPILTATLRRLNDEGEKRNLHKAIAMIPGDEPMAYLFDRFNDPAASTYLNGAIERYPRRALRAIAAETETIAPELRPRLAQIAQLVPEPYRADISDAERAAIEGLSIGFVPEAPLEDLPLLLSSPSWTKKRPRRKAVVLDGLEAPGGDRVLWSEGERERWSTTASAHSFYSRNTDDDWRRYLRELGTRDSGRMVAIALTYAPRDIAATVLDQWDGTYQPYAHTDLNVILSRFEAVAAQRVVKALQSHPQSHEVLVPILSIEAARLAADWFNRLKTARSSAIAWIDRHGVDGLRLLVPDALSADKKARNGAEGLLAYAAARLGADVLAEAAAPYGPEAAEAIQALTGGDPLEPRGVKIPKTPHWLESDLLPQVLLADGDRALPAAAIPHLATVLALASPEYPYPGLDIVAEACDRDSLARFSRALFLLWIGSGAPAKDGWAMVQLSHFADDDTVRLLAPMIREWPGQNQHKRAVTGLGVLGAIGTEEALRAIQSIAEKVKFKALKEEAGVQMSTIAARLGLSREELADRLVPSFGLDEHRALVLDYGSRKFKVVFDEHLKPYVTDEDGKPRKSLPKPGAKDDPERATAAYQRFSQLKKDLRTASADQVARLERALVTGRSWTADEFRRFFAEHPLVKHLARRLVWLAETDGVRSGFRIAEDGSLSDAADDPCTLPDRATVRLAHPIVMEPEELEAWGELLGDYEILQPFAQLGRPVMAFTEEERATGRLTRFEGAKVEVGHLLGLTKHGWRRAAPEDAGVEPGIHYPLPGGGHFSIGLDPGIWVGMIGENPVQTLTSVRYGSRERYWHAFEDEPIRDIDPLTASEILGDLARITNSD